MHLGRIGCRGFHRLHRLDSLHGREEARDILLGFFGFRELIGQNGVIHIPENNLGSLAVAGIGGAVGKDIGVLSVQFHLYGVSLSTRKGTADGKIVSVLVQLFGICDGVGNIGVRSLCDSLGVHRHLERQHHTANGGRVQKKGDSRF